MKKIFLFLTLVSIIFLFNGCGPVTIPEDVQEIDLAELADELQQNPLRAEENYEKKWFIFNGYLRTATDDRFYIECPLDSGKAIIRCSYIGRDVKTFVMNLNKGDSVQIIGWIDGFTFNDLSVSNSENVQLKLNIHAFEIENR